MGCTLATLKLFFLIFYLSNEKKRGDNYVFWELAGPALNLIIIYFIWCMLLLSCFVGTFHQLFTSFILFYFIYLLYASGTKSLFYSLPAKRLVFMYSTIQKYLDFFATVSVSNASRCKYQ